MSDAPPATASRVLVVDDEPDVAETTAAYLSREYKSMAVETATNADEGLARLEGGRFDCVVSDYSMPGRDGLELLEAIREAEPDLPFVLFTGKGSEEIASRAISAGVTDYLQKTGGPEQFERLANRVVHALAARRAERDARESKAHLEAVIESTTDVILTIDAESTVQFVNKAVERVFGYPPEDVVGESLTTLMSEALGDRHRSGLRRYLEEGTRTVDWTQFETTGRHRDGHNVPLSISFSEFTRDGEQFFTGIIRDIADRVRSEARIAGLNELLAEYMAVDDRQKLCNLTVEAATDRLALPATAIALMDDDRGSLRVVARTPTAQRDFDLSGELGPPGGLAWDAFTTGEPTILTDPNERIVDGSLASAAVLVYPLGRHGVFVTAVDAEGSVPDPDVDYVENVVASLHEALDRVEREALLLDREGLLEEQNEWLDQLNRLNEVIRDIDRGLVGAATREAIERTVCETLVEDGPFGFAWVGQFDPVSGGVEPRTWAGDGQGILDGRTASDPADDDPTARAARDREAVVAEDVLGDPPLAGWRKAVIERGFRSCMAIPLRYRDRVYGVLTVYADDADAFDELERAVLEEFGGTIGHAMNAVESTQALVSDTVVELEFTVDPASFPFLAALELPAESAFELQGIVPGDDRDYRVFFTLRNAPADAVERLEETGVVRDCTLIADWEAVSLFECTVSETNFVAWLLDHGAVPREVTVNGRAHATVELGEDADVRAFVDRFQDTYSGTELVARREHERPVRTRETFLAELGDQLTARQLEVLQTAYLSGYFEAPRRRTGEEVAASLDISQPTFSDHLRAGLRKLLGLVFETQPDDRR